ncbi:MAG: hypothetical protein ABSG53_18725 [Thermoguttaceae bacterium]|jgi:hypothetical protein
MTGIACLFRVSCQAEYECRRYWLAISLVPILMVIGLLVLYIRAMPIPEKPADSEGEGTTGK